MNEAAPFVRIVLGALILVVAAGMRFNQPSWTRSYARASGYYSTLALYIGIHLAGFFLLIGFTQLLGRETNVAPLANTVLLPLAVSLALLVSPAHDGFLRLQLQRLAGVPDDGERLAESLAACTFVADARLQRRMKAVLTHRGIDPDLDWFEPARPAQALFLKSAMVCHELRTWDEQGKYASFVAEARREFDDVRDRFDKLAFKVARTLLTIERLGSIKAISARSGEEGRSIDDTLKRIIGDVLGDLRDDIDLFYRDVRLLVARGVLSSEWTAAGRQRALRRIGFVLDEPQVPNPYQPLFYAAGLMMGGTAFLVAIAVRQADLNISKLALTLIITTTHVGAIAIAIVSKRRWGFANAGIRDRMPVVFIVAAGLAGVLISLVLNLIAGSLSQAGVFERLRYAAPWMPAAFITGSVTAFLVQDNRWAGVQSGALRRGADGVIMGLLWGLGYQVALEIMPLIDVPVPKDQMPLLWIALGVAIGVLLPEQFRRPWQSRLREAIGSAKPTSITTPG